MALFDHAYVLRTLLASRFDAQTIGTELGVADETIAKIARENTDTRDPNFERRLYELALRAGLHGLLSTYPALPVPTYDYFRDWGSNFTAGPRLLAGAVGTPRVPPALSGHKLFDRSVRTPLGLAASPLTANSKFIAYYASKGFDVLTYKTVRSREFAAHPMPNWGFAGGADPDEVFDHRSDFEPVVSSQELPWSDLDRLSMVNSFGIPSEAPERWMADVRAAVRVLAPDQQLIVSVTGTRDDGGGDSDQRLLVDFVRVAKMAADASNESAAIELDLSCPNVSGEFIYVDNPAFCLQVCHAVVSAVSVPVVAKIGYLDEAPLTQLAASLVNKAGIAGFTAINAVKLPVVDRDGRDFFPPRTNPGDRRNGGLSGHAISRLSRDVASVLARLRESMSAKYVIIGVGGIGSEADVRFYLDELGVDVVQVCTAALLNPDFAIGIVEAYDTVVVSR